MLKPSRDIPHVRHRVVSPDLITPYTTFEGVGITIIVVTAAISLVCSLILLSLLGRSMWRRRSAPSDHFFVRTHAAAYFTCLLVADVMQSIGTMMSIRWVSAGAVTLDNFCNAQGAIKNAGNLAISLWTLVLSIHTFCVLSLRWRPRDWALYATLIGVWFLVALLVGIVPFSVYKPNTRPYFGISGHWCWISNAYPVERVLLEYAWMFASAVISFILYALTFLRLRGNIYTDEGKISFRMIDTSNTWKAHVSRDSTDIQMTAVAKGMIGFPVMFTVLILPIAICRFISWSGTPVPFEATVFADSVFSLTGVFDLVLFVTTRSLFPANDMVPSWLHPRPKVSAEVMEHGVQPYNVKDFSSVHGFNDIYQSEAERGMVTLPPRTSSSLKRARSPVPPRPSRPASLGEIPFAQPPLPPIPDDDRSTHSNDRRMTARTIASRYSQDDDAAYAAYMWDEIDLNRSPTKESPHSPEASREARYTAFSLSAYEYSGQPSMGSPGLGTNFRTAQDDARDTDDRYLVRPTNPRAKYLSADSSITNSELQIPPPARRF